MYNRYIPQSDGSYRRNPIPEQRPQPQHKPSPPQKTTVSPPVQQFPTQPTESITGFLRHLLPKEFDTGDLIIVLLLLLMAGDNPESRSNALLTLALYFVL